MRCASGQPLSAHVVQKIFCSRTKIPFWFRGLSVLIAIEFWGVIRNFTHRHTPFFQLVYLLLEMFNLRPYLQITLKGRTESGSSH